MGRKGNSWSHRLFPSLHRCVARQEKLVPQVYKWSSSERNIVITLLGKNWFKYLDNHFCSLAHELTELLNSSKQIDMKMTASNRWNRPNFYEYRVLSIAVYTCPGGYWFFTRNWLARWRISPAQVHICIFETANGLSDRKVKWDRESRQGSKDVDVLNATVDTDFLEAEMVRGDTYMARFSEGRLMSKEKRLSSYVY